MEICFVLAPGQNHFFVEMVDAIRDELDQAQVANRVAVGAYPEADSDTVFVLLPPHEYFLLTPPELHPSKRQLKKTVFVCAEQPDTSFFLHNAELAAIAGNPVLDINELSIKEFATRGVKAQHFQLGWTRTWSHFDPHDEDSRPAPRSLDVLHLGTRSDRRERVIGQATRFLVNHNCLLSLGDNGSPLKQGDADWVGEDAKWRLLGDTRVLLNIHRDDRPYFEWLRLVQAMCNGATVVSDWSNDTAPLQPGTHFLHAIAGDLGPTTDLLLRDEPLRREIAVKAYEMLRDELPLSDAVATLVDAADSIAGRPFAGTRRESVPRDELTQRLAVDSAELQPERFDFQLQVIKEVEEDDQLRAENVITQHLREQKLEIRRLQGDIARIRMRAERDGHEPGRVELVHQTPAHRAVQPSVSVITPLYNYEAFITRALASVTRSDFRDYELIVVDDGSTDDSLAVAKDWVKTNPQIPALLLTHPTNRGLGHARNSAVSVARGEYVFALDADNSVYPAGIGRLVRRLEADPEASFAYGYLERHDPEFRSIGLLSSYPWNPHRFGDGNYIDAMVLWRKQALIDLGMYTTDQLLYGWEDYELFLRLADSGGYGTLERQFVARYRTSDFSMSRTTNMSALSMAKQLTEMYPRILNPEAREAANQLTTERTTSGSG
ncbi:MAG: glycosyltransferase [Solirubrobacterales bacterium]